MYARCGITASAAAAFAVVALAAAGFGFAPAAASGPGEPARGREVYLRACQPCHDVEPNAHQVGPSLYGVVGREIGTAEGYRRYSAALRQASGTWTPERLDRYLGAPRDMFPGQRKLYDGLKNAQDRVDLIAYLRHLK